LKITAAFIGGKTMRNRKMQDSVKNEGPKCNTGIEYGGLQDAGPGIRISSTHRYQTTILDHRPSRLR